VTFAESYARWLLVLHTALAVGAVGAATHLALWMRGYWRGELGRHRAIRRFALLSLALHAAAFLCGNAIYPTYRVRVRAEYLEYPTAVAEEDAVRARAKARWQDEAEPAADQDGDLSRQRVAAAARAARWFDVKEHWLALGLFASIALAWLLWRWDPRRDGVAIAPIAALLAVCVALTLWAGAIIGVLTAAWRAV
jgi:hypothetical protein